MRGTDLLILLVAIAIAVGAATIGEGDILKSEPKTVEEEVMFKITLIDGDKEVERVFLTDQYSLYYAEADTERPWKLKYKWLNDDQSINIPIGYWAEVMYTIGTDVYIDRYRLVGPRLEYEQLISGGRDD